MAHSGPITTTCCIMDESEETEAAGVLAIKKKKERKRTELLIVANSISLPSLPFADNSSLCQISSEITTGLLC